MSADRDLAAAIYREMCSKATAAEALDLWQHRRLGPSDLDDIAAVLAAITRHAIDRALFRRLAEVARTGPWEAPEEEWRSRLAAQCGLTLVARQQRDEALRKLAEITATRTGPWEDHPRSEHYERMQAGLARIVSWSEAYPLDIFPEPDLKKARELLEAGGITLDAISAHCMRHVIDGVGKIAREAGRTGPWEGGHHAQEEDGYPGSLVPKKRGTP